MRAVLFDPDDLRDTELLKWWNAWRARSAAGTAKLIRTWEVWLASETRSEEFTCEFDKTIWKDLKLWLAQHVFHWKCAYCESNLLLDRYFGDAEHFRPKARVTVSRSDGARARARCRFPDDTERNHPGYFWLAYNWRNLVPSCAHCNEGQGKGDEFPTTTAPVLQKRIAPADVAQLRVEERADLLESPRSTEMYFLGPTMLDAEEQPLILNPLNPDALRYPRRHLRYGIGGTVVSVDESPLGETSIRVYNLRRDPLQRLRQTAQEIAHRIYYQTLQQPGEDMGGRLSQALNHYLVGEADYSSAALDYLRAIQRRQQIDTEELLGPF